MNFHQSMHPRRPRGSQSGREKRRDESFQVRAKEPLDHRLSPNYFQTFKRMPAPDWAQKNALYYCAQSANSFSRVLFLSSYTTPIVSPYLPGSFTRLVLARKTFIFYFPNQKRRNYRWVEKTFGMLLAGAIQFSPRILWELAGSKCIVNNRKFKMRRRRESQISNSLTRGTGASMANE